MLSTRQIVKYPITTFKTAIFTLSLSASVLLPMLSSPGIAHATGGVNNTRGDNWGTLELPGTDSRNLGGNGVAIFSNGSAVSYNPNKPNNSVNGILSGEEWQCVKLVNRLYLTKGWTKANWPGYGSQMYDNTPSGLTKEAQNHITYLAPGDVLTLNDGGWGHVNVVNTVTASGSSYSIQMINQNTDQVFTSATLTGQTLSLGGGWASGYTVTGVTHAPSGGSTTDNTILQTKKITATDGTNEAIWSKGTDVEESWWNTTTNGPQVAPLLHISQGDIKSFDIELYPDNKHDLFVATAHNIWEVWWYPGQGLHVSSPPILSNIGNIKKIIKTHGPDGVTNQIYVLMDTGAYEYYWNSGTNGIQHDTIMSLSNPVDEYKEIEADGSQALFIADQNYPYEQRWGGGLSNFQQTTFSSVSGITSLSYSQDADAKHRLYVGASSGAIWEDSWYTGGGIGYWYMTGGSGVVALQKWESDSTQIIYEATNGGVFEYSWPITSNTLTGRTIIGGLSSVHAFNRSTDTNNVPSVYTATGTNVLESWWPQGSTTITTGQIE